MSTAVSEAEERSFVRFPFGFRVHKAWVMVVGCALFSMGTLAVVFGTNGVFYVAVCEDMGFSRGDISAWQQVHFLVSIPCMPIAAKLLEKFGSRIVLTITGVSCAAAAALMGTYTEVWQWNISAVLYGSLGVLGTMELACPIVIGNWFEKRAGFAIGLMGAVCALSTSVIVPLFTVLIDAIGWRSAYFVQAGVIGLLCVPFALFVSHLRPQDIGALPYGFEEANCGASKEIKADSKSCPDKTWRVIATCPFMLLFFFAGISSFIASGFDAHLVGFATANGHTALYGSLLVSSVYLGSSVQKLAMGWLSDRLGLQRAACIGLSFVLLGMLGFLIFDNEYLLLASAFFFGAQDSCSAVFLPLLVRQRFGLKNYAQIFSWVSIGSGVVGSFGSRFVGYTYDMSSSFSFAFACGMVLCLLNMVLVFATSHDSKTQQAQ